MKIKFLPSVAFLTLFSTISFAQSPKVFAVTGKTKGDITWNFVREINMQTAALEKNIFPVTQQTLYYDALTRLPISAQNIINPTTEIMQGIDLNEAVPDVVAALAYDSKFNRLYYTYMHGTDLRYIDLNNPQPKQYVVRHASLKPFATEQGEEDVITRMAFTPDGYGYALTNNSKHLIKFSSGEKIVITDLGSLTDGKKNGNMSVHTLCTSYGGDMLADAFGNLYLYSQKGNIFKINPSTKVADFIGAIKGLPEAFTVNGVAVDNNDHIILSCATSAEGYYLLDMKTLIAEKMASKENEVYNASDLASASFLYQKQVPVKSIGTEVLGNEFVTISPNPVTGRSFDLKFNNIPAGNYSIEILDATGNTLYKKEVNIITDQTEKIMLPSIIRSGIFNLKVISKDVATNIYTNKIVVGR